MCQEPSNKALPKCLTRLGRFFEKRLCKKHTALTPPADKQGAVPGALLSAGECDVARFGGTPLPGSFLPVTKRVFHSLDGHTEVLLKVLHGAFDFPRQLALLLSGHHQECAGSRAGCASQVAMARADVEELEVAKKAEEVELRCPSELNDIECFVEPLKSLSSILYAVRHGT